MAFSTKFPPFTGQLSPAVEQAVAEIRSFFSLDEVYVLTYDDQHIVVPITYQVSIPPRGAVGGIDIRENEPMLVKISLTGYPTEIPFLATDREDFPKKFLSHLYASEPGEPARLCLVRNSPNEWFASKRISDFLEVGKEWLFKAAAGLLTEDGDEFDPVRLENYFGRHSYKYDMLYNAIKTDARFVPEISMAALLTYCRLGEDIRTGILKSIAIIPFIQVAGIIEAEKKVRTSAASSQPHLPFFSLLIWNENEETCSEYLTELPTTFGELLNYFEAHGIDVNSALDVFLKNGMHLRTGIPIIHAIRRPRKVIGYNGEYEFFNFIAFPDSTTGRFSKGAEVKNQLHIEPLSSVLASKLTGELRQKGILFIGAGSLGSKIIYHEARAGNKKLAVVDHDTFLYHNLARHVLGATHIGQNKATAIVNEITSWYELDTDTQFAAYPNEIEKTKPEIINKYPWIIDTTASMIVQNWLTLSVLPATTTVARCELVDEGRVGLLYIEGENRNPRIDDLINFTYYQGKENIHIRKWRLNDAQREPTTIDIGLGCSSTTSIVSDDTISGHAALFSKVFYQKREVETKKAEGLIYVSVLDSSGVPKLRNETLKIKPFSTFSCAAGSDWEIRMAHGLKERLLALCKAKKKNETGGVLIGVSNYKTKTIHVFEIINEPQDSKGTCTGFTRGINDLPKQVDTIKKNTGGVIGYIGEWHTHPMDLEDLSTRDRETIKDLQAINRKTPICNR